MPRIPKNEVKTRLHLDLTERVRERLEKVRTISEADTFTEVVRRALTIYDMLLVATREGGGKVVVRYPNGTEETVALP